MAKPAESSLLNYSTERYLLRYPVEVFVRYLLWPVEPYRLPENSSVECIELVVHCVCECPELGVVQ